MKEAIFDEIGVNCGRYTIFLSKVAIRFEYVSFAGGTRCSPKLPHLGVIWDSIIYTVMYQQQHELRESFTQYQLFTTQMSIKSGISLN